MSGDNATQKTRILGIVEEHMQVLIDLSAFLHDNPEIAFEEYKASESITDIMHREGFTIERGIGDLDTAFKASSSYGTGRPVIAVLAEYDALPEIGHACGHNLIAAMSVGAAIAANLALRDSGHDGTIILMGTPAEERGGGKGILVSKGCFDGIDCAMMVHPSSHTRAEDSSLASTRVILRYTGKGAHAAAAPWSGANALEAAIQTFNLINAWRCQLRGLSRINGIITKGGTAVNIIPEHAEAQFGIRAADRGYLEELVEKVHNCAESAAAGMGVTIEFERVGRGYDALRNNPVLKNLIASNFTLVGEEVVVMPRGAGMSSTDMGNVTQALPGLHCYIKVKGDIQPHTPAFAAACVGESAARAIAAGAKALGMTAMDLFSEPRLVEEARSAFDRKDP